MAKDPAFLFYPADAAEDTQHLNRLERGAYFDILKAQKRFGKFTEDQIQKVLGKDFETVWPSLKICLTYENHMYFIAWVHDAIEKRKEYSESRRNNRKKDKNSISGIISSSYDKDMKTHEKDMSNISNSYVEHMGNAIENINTIVNNEEKGVEGEKEESEADPIFDPTAIVPRMLSIWKAAKPKYIIRLNDDFAALGKICRIIQKEESVSIDSVKGREHVLQIWQTLVDFILTDKLYNAFQLTQVEKYFASISSKCVTQGDGDKKSVIHTNLKTANDAQQIIKNKHARKQQAT